MIWQYSILILYTISLVIILVFSISQAYLIYFYIGLKKKEKFLDSNNQASFPVVTIQLPLYNELYVVERLINAVCALNYPKEKLEIQVLDDSDDESIYLTESIIQLKKEEGFLITHIKREKNIGFKAGALQYGLQLSKGEFIAIFDADFLPEKDFLQRLLPYFEDKKIGMVQSRWEHLNRNYSLLTKVQSFGLDGHFTIEQTGRSKAGLFINFNGTAGIWRKTCIADAGGWQHDTLTEDLDLSYRAQLKGWVFEYIEQVATPAELPVELNAFKSQQHRWTKGAIETSKKMIKEVWKTDVGFKKKLFGTLHLMNSYVFLFVFLSSVLSIPVLLIKNQTTISRFYFQIMFCFMIGFIIVLVFYSVAYFSKQKSLKQFASLFPLFLSVSMAMSFHNSLAVLEGFFGFKSDFIRTPKFNITAVKGGFKNNKYIVKFLPKSFYIELLLSIYFLGGLFIAFYFTDFGLFPFHLMLFIGFSTLSFYAIKHNLQKT